MYCRKNHSRQLDALQQSLEEETKAKSEAQRQRKLAEGQVDELQNSLEAAQKVPHERKLALFNS